MRTTHQTRLQKLLWPGLLIAIPALTVIASSITLIIAIRSADPIVVEYTHMPKPYVPQQTLQSAQIHIDTVSGSIQTELQTTTPPQTLTLHFTHPTHAQRDFAITLQHSTATHYSGTLNTAHLHGHWQLLLDAPGQTWQLSGEWDANTDISQLLPIIPNT